MKFNADASLGAVSFSDGSLQIISTMLGDTLYQIKDEDMRFPITNLAWHPTRNESQDAQKVLGSTLEGGIIRWTPKGSNTVEHIELEEKAQYHAIDYTPDGRRFVVAGAQPTIDIYDEERMLKVQSIGDKVAPAHTNKVFTCRYSRTSPGMLYSGGWDQQVRFWDVRANQMTHSIGGVQICGDSVDTERGGNLVVTGGGSKGEGVQLWDFRDTAKPLKTLNWHMADGGQKVNPLVNSCKFVPGTNLVLVGVNDDCAAKCFNYCTGEVVEKFSRVENTCFTLDVSDDGALCGFGDGAGHVHFENINYQV
jgi:WD40 repeat protein